MPSCRRRATGFLTAPFVLAVLILVAAAVLSGPVADWMDLHLTKQSLPLRAPLNTLKVSELAPYKIIERHLMPATMIEALGTDQFLSWTLEDTSVSPDDPLRISRLFVTYYSGGTQLVPHTPDVCYLGAGYEPAQRHENLEVEISSLEHESRRIPIRVCTFRRTAVFGERKHTVVYSFHANGRFVATRTGVRLLVNAPRDTHAYFSKVEVGFPSATRSESVAGAAKLFTRLLPVLLRDHWPDFGALRSPVAVSE